MKTKISAVSFLHEKTSSGAGTWVGYATLSLALLLGLLLPPAARGAAFINFNTPGQLTNYFGVRSTVAGPANTAVWYEVPSGGLGNSGALDGVTGSGTDNTLTYLGESYSWPSTGVGVTLYASMVFKAKLSSTPGSPGIGLGFINVTNGAMEASTANWMGSWVGLRLLPLNPTNFSLAGATLAAPTPITVNNTGAGVQLVASANGSDFTNWYRILATFTRTNGTNITIAGRLDDLGTTGLSAPVTRITYGPVVLTNAGFNTGDIFYGAVRVAENRGADYLDEFAFWMTNGAPVLTTPLTDQIVTAYRPVTFSAPVDGTPGFSYTWYTNGTVVAGATSSTFTIPNVAPALDGLLVKVAVTNAIGGIESSPLATLTVPADGAAPTLVSLGSLDGLTAAVVYNEAVDPATATNASNYSVNSGGPVTGVTLRPDGQTVVLRLTTAASGTLTVTVNNVRDLTGNTIVTGSQISGTVLGLTPADLAMPMTPGSSFSANTGDIDMTGGGTDLYNNMDQGQTALGWRTGDFDVKVRIQGIQLPRPFNTVVAGRENATKVGLMARETIDPTARAIIHTVQPADFTMPVGGNVIQTVQRATANGTAAQLGVNLALPANGGWGPNLWLRLRRVNNTFTSYYATNASPAATAWTQVQQTNTFMTNAMLVGLTVCAHWDDMNYPSSAQFRSYGDVTFPGTTLAFGTNLPSTTNVVLAGNPYTFGYLGTNLTLTVAGTATVAPGSQIMYVWQRDNGAGGFTNLPMASAISNVCGLVLTAADSGSQYRAIATLGGVTATSTVCTVTVSDAVIATATPLLYQGSNLINLSFFRTLDAQSATNPANYLITNSLGETVTVTNVVLIPDWVNGVSYMRAVLFTSVPLTNGTTYSVTVSNVKDATSATLATTTKTLSVPVITGKPVLLEFWTNLLGGAVANLTVTPQYGLSVPDYQMYTNMFGFNTNRQSPGPHGDYFGARASAYFVAPSNAFYRFYIMSDDSGALYMNTNGVNPLGKVQIVANGSYMATYNNTTLSVPIYLTNAQYYYLEALVKEGGANDSLNVTFRSSADYTGATNTPIPTPDIADVIQANVLAPLTGGVVNCSIMMTATNVNEGAAITYYITNLVGMPPFGVQWKSNGVAVAGATGLSYAPVFTAGGNGAIYSATVNNPFSLVQVSAPAAAIVAADVTWPTVTSVVGGGFLTNVYITFSEAVSADTATNVANYQIPGLTVLSAIFGVNNQTVVLMTTPQTGGTVYSLTVSGVRDRASLANVIGNSTVTFTAWPATRGFVRVDRFDNITGALVALLEGAPKFLANQPDLVTYNNYFGYNYAATFGGVADSYGARISALFMAPSNGVYRFYIRADDQATLLMNTNSVNSTDPAGAVIIAALNYPTTRNYGDLGNGPVTSPNITLVGGQMYYMEGRLKENTGNDGFGMAFREQGDSSTPPNTEVASSVFFFTPANPDLVTSLVITRQPASVTLTERAPVTLTVWATNAGSFTTLAYQWQSYSGSAWTDIIFATNTTLWLNPAAGTAQPYRVVITTSGRTLNSATATVTVAADGSYPPSLIGASSQNGQSNLIAFFSEPVTLLSATNLANYTLTNNFGNTYVVTSAVLQADGMAVTLGFSGKVYGGFLTNYTLLANNLVDLDATPKTGSSAYTFYVADQKLRVDRYDTMNAWPMPTNAPMQTNATQAASLLLTNEFYYTTSPNCDNYMGRAYGYFIAPSNGLYRFFLNADDESELWINTNDVNSASPYGKVKVAYMTAANLSYATLSAQTAFIPMRAGQRYYMEGQYREGTGGDYISVAVRDYRNNTIPPAAERIQAAMFSQPEGLTIGFASTTFAENSVGSQIIPVLSAVPNYGAFTTNLTYQWYTNGVAITGATSSNCPLPSPLPASANGWTITVIATNNLTVVGSNVTVLTVVSNPIVITQPQNVLVGVSNDASFSVTAGGSGLGYYWYSNGVFFSSGSSTLSLPAVSAQSAPFYVVVSNAWGMATSQVAQLTVQTFSSVALDFNTAGQLTNNFFMRNKASLNQIQIWYETNSGGVAGTGALDGVNNNGQDNTVVYHGDAFPSASNAVGSTLYASIMFKAKAPNAGNVALNPQVQLGFISSTNGYMEGSHSNLWAGNWMALRTAIATNATNFYMEGGVYAVNLSNNANLYVSSYSPTNSWVATNGLTNWYRLTAAFSRTNGTNVAISGVMEDLGPLGVSAPVTRVTFAQAIYTNAYFVQSWFYPAFRAIENNGVDYLDNFAAWRSGGVPFFVLPPTDQGISTYRAATFTAKVDGLPPFSFQWYTNGVAVPGGTTASYTTPTCTAAGSLTVKVAVTNSLGGLESGNATLTVTADATAPTLTAVGSVDGRFVDVAFSEAVSSTTALNTNNYTISSGVVVAAAFLGDTKTVRLTLAAAITGGFSVTINNVADLAGNPIAASSVASGTVFGLIGYDVGAPSQPGYSISLGAADLDVTTGGADIAGYTDQGHLDLVGWRTGDFDVKVRVASIGRATPFTTVSSRDDYARAHVLARESYYGGAKMVAAGLYGPDYGLAGGVNQAIGFHRPTTLGTITSGTAVSAPGNGGWFPNMWLRLRRVNNTFTTYYATNANPGVYNWTTNYTVTLTLSNSLLVGLGTSAHYDRPGWTVAAQYRGFSDVTFSDARVLTLLDLPTSVTASFVDTGATTTTLNYGVGVANAPESEVQVVWQRGDGLGGFTNVPTAGAAVVGFGPGSSLSSFTTPVLSYADNGAQYRAIAKISGSISATSSVCTLTVTNAQPSLSSSVVYAADTTVGSNVLILTFNEPLDPVSAAIASNYVISGFPAITVTNAYYLPPLAVGANYSRVVLYTSQPIKSGISYAVQVNGVKDINNLPIAASGGRAITFSLLPANGPALVELFTGIANGTVPDLTNNVKYQANLADQYLYTNYFGFDRTLPTTGFNTYGARVSGYFVAPTNGDYRFFIKGDDGNAFYMNTNALNSTDPTRKVQLTYASVWGYYSNIAGVDMTVPVTLIAGQRYYIEALLKQNTGGDGVCVFVTNSAFTTTMGNVDVYIPTNYLEQPAGPVGASAILVTPAAIAENQIVTLSISNLTGALPYSMQWKSNGVAISGARGPSLATPLPAGAVTFSVVVDNLLGSLEKTVSFSLPADSAGPTVVRAVGSAFQTNVTLTFSEPVTEATANVVGNYQIDGLSVLGAWLKADGTNFLLTTSPQTPGTVYNVKINNIRDRSAAGNVIATDTTVSFTAWTLCARGFVTVDLFTNLAAGSTAIQSLAGEPKFAANAVDFTTNMTAFAWGTNGAGTFLSYQDYYGARAYAWFLPPSNGVYRFYIRQDDSGELYMNTNYASGLDPVGKVVIAASYTSGGTYGDLSYGPCVSPNIPLQAGQAYYMEMLLREGGGNDGLSMAFREQSDPSVPANTEAALGQFFRNYGDPAIVSAINISPQPADQTLMSHTPTILTCGAVATPAFPVSYNWQQDRGDGIFTNLLNGMVSNYTVPFTPLGINHYRCEISTIGKTVYTVTNTVTASNDVVAPYVVQVRQANTPANTVPSRIKVYFSEPVDPVTATATTNYLIDGGATVTSVDYNTLDVMLNVTGLQPGAFHNVSVKDVVDFGTPPNVLAPSPTNFTIRVWAGITNNGLRREWFTNLTKIGNTTWVSQLMSDPKYVNNRPDVVDYLNTWNSLQSSPALDHYGLRMSGFLVPSISASYTFWTYSDDESRFYMSTNDDPANLRLIVRYPDGVCCGTGYGSSPVPLVAGQVYYVEGQLKEGTGGDYFHVTWSNSVEHLAFADIPSTNLFFAETPQWTLSVTSQPPANYNISEQVPAIFTVGAYSWQPGIAYQWYSNGVVLADQTNYTFAITNTPPSLAATVSCMVTARVENGAMMGGTYTRWYAVTSVLNVIADYTAPTVARAAGNEMLTNVIVTFSERVSSASAQNVANYAVGDGVNLPLSVLSATIQADGSNVVLHTSGQTPGVVYYVTNNNIVDLATTPNTIAPNTITPFTAWTVQLGMLAVDVFTNLTGGAVTDLANLMAKAATNAPDLRTTIRSFDWHTMPMPYTVGGLTNYGVKVWGWFQPPTNGLYKFYIRGDDATKLYLNTNGATPAGKMLIAQDDIAGHTYTNGTNIATGNASANISPAVSLTNGTSYYIEGWMKQATGAEYLQVDFCAAGAAAPQAPTTQGGGGYPNAFYPGNEVASGAYFGLAYNPDRFASLVAFSQQPNAATNVAAGQPVSLSALAAATPVSTNNYLAYQWQTSSDGATWINVLPPSTNYNCDYAMLGVGTNYTANYYYSTLVRVVASAFPSGISVASSVATVTVPDGLNVLSVGSLNGNSVVVVFDRPVNVSGDFSAADIANYSFNGGSLVANSATVQPDGRSVVLVPESPLAGVFTVEVLYINDVTGQFNCFTAAFGTVLAPSFANDVGLTPGTGDPLVRGSAVSTIVNGVDVVAGGSDIWNAADSMYYVAWPITGNFDVRVRVPSITNSIVVTPNSWSKAGLLARISTNANSREMSIVTTPPILANTANSGQDVTSFQYRDTIGVASLSVYSANTILPAWVGTNSPWVRLVRTNSVFSGYWSSNGVNWVLVGSRDASANGGAYPDTILVGLATSAHDNLANPVTSTVQAQYRDLYKLTPPTVTVVTDTPGISLYRSAVFTAIINSDPYPPTSDNPRWIKWLNNGVEIVGSNDMTLTLPSQSVAGVHTITAYVGNNGGATPAFAYLSVTNGLPLVTNDLLAATQNVARTFSVATDFLGNDRDPEGDPLSLTLISSNAVRFISDFNSGLPSGTAVYGSAVVTNADGYAGGCLKLTPAITNMGGSFFVNDFASGQPVYGFRANFKVLLTNNGTVLPADGFSFVFGTNLTNSAFPVAEDGIGNNLIVSFDSYNNGAASTDGAYPAPSVEVRWGGNTTNFNIGYCSLTNAFGNANWQYTNANWQDIEIYLKPGGLLDITLGTRLLFSNLPTPYTNQNILSGAQFALGARTGGAYETHWIDNLSIVATLQPIAAGFAVAPAAGTIIEFASDLGGAVSKNGGVLSYTPPGVNVCGPDTIRYLASDGQVGGVTLGMATVTLADRTGPTLVSPNIVTNTTSSSRIVNFVPSFSDNCDSSPVLISCVPPSGTDFPLGTNTVTCTAYDASLNTNTGAFTVTVEKTISGSVALEGYVGPAGDGSGARTVTFKASDGSGLVTRQRDLVLTFVAGVASYTLDVPAGTVNLSAKTAWHLRKRQSVTLAGGPVVANFTGGNSLSAGDVNNSNGVDLADYNLLVAAWYTANPAADLDGNGRVDLDDYFLLASHWLETGAGE